MDDDTASADDERATELSSIAAIFPELALDPSSPYRATLELAISPLQPLKIRFQQSVDGIAPNFLPTPPKSIDTGEEGRQDIGSLAKVTEVDQTEPEVHYLSHLPPLTLAMELPSEYPTEKPPLLALSTSPAWLSNDRIQTLLDDGLRLWEEIGQDQVIFSYIDHLQQEAERGFGLNDDPERGASLPRELNIALLDFDIKAKREAFENETFECGVCLEPKKGAVCHRLILCSHVFCVQCLQDFYNNCITEGEVENVKCLAPDCGMEPNTTSAREQAEPTRKGHRRRKQDHTLSPSELLQIPLTQEIVQRYVHLKRKKRLESDKNTIYCPRKWCQGAARSKKHPKPDGTLAEDDYDSAAESEEQAEQPDASGSEERKLPPMSERLSICEDCAYAFCSVCKKGWHGELGNCDPRKEAELSAEEKASQEYLALHTTPCPTCNAPCQKTMGCNHMICFKCTTHFCYLCSSYLMESNPYQHFNDPQGSCYMRLWELESGDDGENVGLGFGGGALDEAVWDVADSSDSDDDVDDDDAMSDSDFDISDESDDDAPPQNLRDNLRPRHQPPPPAPNPPRQAAEVVRGPHDRRAMAANVRRRPALAPRDRNGLIEAPIVAPGQGNQGAQQPAPVRAMGLERFLELAQQDREEEWDSDELDDVEGPVGGHAGVW